MKLLWPVFSLVLAMFVWLQTAQLHKAQDQVAELERQQELAWAQHKNLEARYRHAITQQDQQTKSAIAAAHADAGRARAAATGLRRELAGFIEAHRHRAQTASAAGQCAPDDAASVVLAELFSRADDAAGELAAAFDEARARGLGCEASYGAVAGGG
jgi:hypothetical protein